jgi:hypothetical protein
MAFRRPVGSKIQDPKAQPFLDNSEDSRNSTHGYLEMGNDAQVHAKARALRNNSNRGAE